MRVVVERCDIERYNVAIIDIFGPGGPSIPRGLVGCSLRHGVFLGGLKQACEIIMRHYDARLVMKVDSQVHIWQVLNKLLHHP